MDELEDLLDEISSLGSVFSDSDDTLDEVAETLTYPLDEDLLSDSSDPDSQDSFGVQENGENSTIKKESKHQNYFRFPFTIEDYFKEVENFGLSKSLESSYRELYLYKQGFVYLFSDAFDEAKKRFEELERKDKSTHFTFLSLLCRIKGRLKGSQRKLENEEIVSYIQNVNSLVFMTKDIHSRSAMLFFQAYLYSMMNNFDFAEHTLKSILTNNMIDIQGVDNGIELTKKLPQKVLDGVRMNLEYLKNMLFRQIKEKENEEKKKMEEMRSGFSLPVRMRLSKRVVKKNSFTQTPSEGQKEDYKWNNHIVEIFHNWIMKTGKVKITNFEEKYNVLLKELQQLDTELS